MLLHRGAGPESITNALRAQIPIARAGGDYRHLTVREIYIAHKDVYEDLGIPEVMEVVQHWFGEAGLVFDEAGNILD